MVTRMHHPHKVLMYMHLSLSLSLSFLLPLMILFLFCLYVVSLPACVCGRLLCKYRARVFSGHCIASRVCTLHLKIYGEEVVDFPRMDIVHSLTYCIVVVVVVVDNAKKPSIAHNRPHTRSAAACGCAQYLYHLYHFTSQKREPSRGLRQQSGLLRSHRVHMCPLACLLLRSIQFGCKVMTFLLPHFRHLFQ